MQIIKRTADGISECDTVSRQMTNRLIRRKPEREIQRDIERYKERYKEMERDRESLKSFESQGMENIKDKISSMIYDCNDVMSGKPAFKTRKKLPVADIRVG